MIKLKKIIPLAFLGMLVIINLSGCGNGGFETESRLEIAGFNPNIIQSDVVETTDDYGIDGVANTDDDGEGDNRPQPGEEVTVPLTEDKVTVEFTNKLRAGSTTGVDIEIYKYVISYYDENGLTPVYAPQTIHDVQFVVPSGGTATVDVIIVDSKMKFGWLENDMYIVGLRHIYLYDYSKFKNKLYAQIDFYGRDPLNSNPAFTSGVIEIHFENYDN